MKIYTKTGDNGTTGLIGGTRVQKDDIRLYAYGSIDELNSFISLLIVENLEAHDAKFLQETQHLLFRIGSWLATDTSVTDPNFPIPVTKGKLQSIETEIDNITSNLPEINKFVLPGGNKASALCHVCRTVCRRAERNLIKTSKKYPVDKSILIFINRLSDYLFVLGRKACLSDGPEIFWDNAK